MLRNESPLSERMRPNTVKEIVGQPQLTGEGGLLTRMVDSNLISSIILYGPPGTGKTSIAHALSKDLKLPFKYFNASTDNKKELQNMMVGVTRLTPAIALLDEIHRLTKPNQDLLLSYIEEGSLVLVGATTENPYMSIIPALRSRVRIIEVNLVQPEEIKKVLERALKNKSKGFGNLNIIMSEEDLLHIGNHSNGDVRVALNSLELIVKSTKENENNEIVITRDSVNSCLQIKQIGGDKDGDTHYNLLSAFQKSIRGSDVDASLHYLARLIESGDLMSILRRLLVISYEDIGLADHNIHNETLNAVETAERVGLPEARIPLSYIVIRLALSPKSNVAYKAISKASSELYSNKSLEIPKTLQDNHYKGAKNLNKGIGYKYPHDYSYGIVKQQYIPYDFKQDRYLTFRDDSELPEVQKIYRSINKIVKEV